MTRATLSEEIIIASWWKNRGGEAPRVRLIAFAGRSCIDLRTWRCNSKGILLPTTAGLTCDIKHLAEFAQALRAAARKTEELGLVPTSDKEPC